MSCTATRVLPLLALWIAMPVACRGDAPNDRDGAASPPLLVSAGAAPAPAAAAVGIMPEIDPTIALGFASAVTDLADLTPQGGTLYVFSLPAAGDTTARSGASASGAQR